MGQLSEVERAYDEVASQVRRRTNFTLQWEHNRAARRAQGSADAAVLGRYAALRDEMIRRGLLGSAS